MKTKAKDLVKKNTLSKDTETPVPKEKVRVF